MQSVPIYNWQPFVQTPSINPDENLDLELGETIYEDKWIHEWYIALKFLLLILPFFMGIFIYNYFYNGLTHGQNTMGRLLPFNIPLPYVEMYPESDRIEKFLAAIICSFF